MEYHCNSCNFHTNHKTKYEKHNETKKHIVAINNEKSPIELDNYYIYFIYVFHRQ